MRYQVKITKTTYYTLEVEADDEDEAENEAMNKLQYDLENCEEDDEEFEMMEIDEIEDEDE